MLAALAFAAPAQAQGPTAPSLAPDTTFAPPTGVSDFDFTPGTSVDAPGGVAVHGSRIYTVGETRINASNPSIAITARRLDGTLDPRFSDDGKLTLDLAAGTQRDAGYDMVALPDGRLRVLATTDTDAGTQSSQVDLDVALVGLHPDGSLDSGFGSGGVVTFGVGAGNDVPSRMTLGPDGRLAIAGCVIAGASGTSCGSGNDFFVAVRNADGSAAAFGVAGARTFNRGGTSGSTALNDRAVDVAFRPGGGVLALLQVETNPDPNDNDWHAVLRAFGDDGSDDARFSADGDLDLPIGDPDVVPGGMMVHDGRLWVTGAVRSGDNGEAFLARVGPDGGGLQFITFDIRGGSVPADVAMGSQGNDVAVVPGVSPTLVVGGFATLSEGTSWAAAAFREFEGDLTRAVRGEAILELPRNASGIEQQGTLLGLAPGGDDWVAAAGSLLDLNSADTSFGTARLVIDAEKQCDLALEVPRPLEIGFDGLQPATVDVRVTNVGTRACSGTVGVSPGYQLGDGATLATGLLGPGASRTFDGRRLVYSGARRRDDAVTFTLAAPGDGTAANNRRTVRAVFRYCDVQLRRQGAAGALPSEGARRVSFEVRNIGTVECRGVRVGVASGGRRTDAATRFRLLPGRSADEEVRVALAGARRQSARVSFRVVADGDVDAGNDRAALAAPVVRVGDTAIRRASRRTFGGRASGGAGRVNHRLLRVSSVEVAVSRRAGRRCRWATRSGALRTGSCSRPVWIRARGTRGWRVSLRRALPRGRYIVRSRAVIRAGFAEARFSKRDGNLRALRVR